MARKILNQQSLSDYLNRLDQLQAATKPQWGSMNAARMAAHLTQTFRLSLGEVEVVDKSNWFLRNVVLYLAFEAMPMPRNVKAPAVFEPTSVSDFEVEIDQLRKIMARFALTANAHPNQIGTSPLFGPIPLSYWERIHAVHLEHHFKQFGL